MYNSYPEENDNLPPTRIFYSVYLCDPMSYTYFKQKNFVKSNKLSSKHQRITPSDWKDAGIRNCAFVAKTWILYQFLGQVVKGNIIDVFAIILIFHNTITFHIGYCTLGAILFEQLESDYELEVYI